MARFLQLILVAVLVSGGFYLISGRPLRLALRSTPAVQKEIVSAPPAPPPPAPSAAGFVVATSGDTTAQPSPPTPPDGPVAITIEVHATDECWLTATADGQRVIYRMLSAGEDARIEARQDIVLRVGDATAVSYVINGATGRQLGAAGDAVTIHVTPSNYREFLSSKPPADTPKGET